MAKDSGEPVCSSGVLFCRTSALPVPTFPAKGRNMKTAMKKTTKKDVIAYRKSCQATGTGLSHYILMDKKAK